LIASTSSHQILFAHRKKITRTALHSRLLPFPLVFAATSNRHTTQDYAHA